jgi:pSer/pThr/pTyr-binding forkhead associated (FHA) protein
MSSRERARSNPAEVDTHPAGEGDAGGMDPTVQFCLTVFEGPNAGVKRVIDRPRLIVGGGDADLHLDGSAAPCFEIEISGLEVRLRDLGAGTHVNGDAVIEAALHDRDEIRIGPVGIIFTASREIRAVAAAADTRLAVAAMGGAESRTPPRRTPTPEAPASKPPAPRRQSVLVEVIEGADVGTTFDLSRPDVYLIGRQRGEVPLTDTMCSAKHAQIEVLGHGECFVEDLSSTNGTFRNGDRIDRSPLEDGDELRIGNTRLRFQRRPDPDPES